MYYHQYVVDKMPESLRALIPPNPQADFRFEEPDGGKIMWLCLALCIFVIFHDYLALMLDVICIVVNSVLPLASQNAA